MCIRDRNVTNVTSVASFASVTSASDAADVTSVLVSISDISITKDTSVISVTSVTNVIEIINITVMLALSDPRNRPIDCPNSDLHLTRPLEKRSPYEKYGWQPGNTSFTLIASLTLLVARRY